MINPNVMTELSHFRPGVPSLSQIHSDLFEVGGCVTELVQLPPQILIVKTRGHRQRIFQISRWSRLLLP